MMGKSLAKEFVGRTASNRFAWSAYRVCGRISDELRRIYGHAQWTRQTSQRDAFLDAAIEELFPDLVVISGPFMGMRYPSSRSVGSALLPKLLGSYESELHPTLEKLLGKKHACIVDIGCAEGYYAIGLALKLANVEVYAFDTDSRARYACSQMALLNGVANRVHIGGLCNAGVLGSLPLGERALIISDCEGYERELFAPAIVRSLARHDLIIETHDFVDIEISTRLRQTFAGTHSIESIMSVDDIQKAHLCQHAKLARYTLSEKRMLLAERRPAIMEWLVMAPLCG